MENDKKRVLVAEGLLFVLAMIWGGTFVAGKVALEAMDPYWIMVFRFFLGGLILGLLRWKDIKKIDKTTLKAGIEVGLLLGVGTGFQMVGLQYTTPAQQSFIIVTYVVTVPLLSWIVYKRYPGNFIIIAALITFVGIGLMSLNESFTMNKGDLLTAVYALLFAIQLLRVGHHANRIATAIGFTIVQFFTSGLLSLFLAFLFGGEFFIKSPNLSAWLGFAYLVLLNTVAAYVIQNYSQKYARPEKSALIISTESLFGALAAYFIVGEAFTPRKILGCLLVFTGIMIAQFGPGIYGRRIIRKEKYKTRKNLETKI